MSDLPVLTRVCDDTIAELEHLHRQDQAKITKLSLQLEKVREANEQLAEQCKENDALRAYCSELKAGLRKALDTSDADYTLSVAAKLELLLERGVPLSLSGAFTQELIRFVDFCIEHESHDKALMEIAFAHYMKQQLREGAKDE